MPSTCSFYQFRKRNAETGEVKKFRVCFFSLSRMHRATARRAASLPAPAIRTSKRIPAARLDGLIAHRTRGAAKHLNRCPTSSSSSSTSTSTAAALPLSSSASASLALLAFSGAAAQASQDHPWGARLSSPLVAMLLGGLAAVAFPSVLPSVSASSASSALSASISGTLVPLAACLALLEIGDDGDDGFGGTDSGEAAVTGAEKKASKAMDPTLAVSLAFAVASLATVAATLAAVSLCLRAPPFFSKFLPAESALPRPLFIKVAACLCASYVGGSVNFAATATALGLSSSAEGARAMAAAFAADLVAMALYFGALAALKVPKGEEEWARRGSGFDVPSSEEGASSAPPSSSFSSSSVSTLSAALSLSAASCSVASGELVAVALGIPSASLAVAALVASAFGFAGRKGRAKKSSSPFAGASAASSALMLLFFALCGAQAGSPASLSAAASLGGFVCLLLALQLAATLALGRGIGGGRGVSLLCRSPSSLFPPLPLPALVVGANAAIGGPGTAAAAAAARSWSSLVRPAVLVGSAGYAIGTGIGVGVAAVLSRA